MKLGLKILGGLVVLAVAVMVAGLTVLKSLDYNQFKGTVERLVEDATGRNLVIDGDLHLAVSLTPTLSVNAIRLDNAAWTKTDMPMVALDRLDAKIALKPLLSGNLEIDYIILDGLTVVLETDGQGRANWEFESQGGAPTSASPDQVLKFNPQVRDVRLRNVQVAYRHGATGQTIEADLARADFSAVGSASPLKGTLAGSYNGVDIEAETTLGSLAQLIASEGPAFPVTMNLSAGNVQADITATVEQPRQGLGVDGRVSLQAKDTTTLSQLVGVTLPDLNRISVLATVSGKGTAFAAQGINVTVGSSDLKGSASVDLGGQRPKVTADLKSNFINLNEVLAGDDVDDASSSDTLFSPDPLPFDLLGVADAQVQMDAKQIKFKTLILDNVAMTAKLQDRRLSVYPFKTGLEGARVSSRVNVDGAAKTPKLDVHTTIRNLNVGTLSALSGQRGMVQLPLDGEVDVQSAGSSVQALVSGANGYTRIVGRDGRLDDKRLVELTEGIGSIFPWVKNKDANVISCVLVKMPIKAGIANAETVVVDTSGVQVNVTGDVNLPEERYNLTINTKAKKTSLASFAVPIEVKGGLLDPEIKVNPAVAVVDTVGNIVKAPAELVGGLLKDTLSLVQSDKEKQAEAAKNDPCIQALSGGKTTPTPAPEAAPSKTTPDTPTDPSKATGDPVKDLERFGEGLKKLF